MIFKVVLLLVAGIAEAPARTDSPKTQDEPGITSGTNTKMIQDIQSLQVQATRAEGEKELAKERERVAKESAEEAQEGLAGLKSGKLMSLGITGGIGLALQTPMPLADAHQDGVATVALPYVLVLPMYWGTSQATREYCASSWTNADEEAATIVAMGIARKSAARKFDAIIDHMRAGFSEKDDELLVKKFFSDDTKSDEYKHGLIFVSGIRTKALPEVDRNENSDDYKKLREVMIAGIADTIWNRTLPGRCLTKKFGLWLGKPLAYTVKTNIPGDPTPARSREFKPTAAFGVGFTPNAYFSLLLGLTTGTLKSDNPERAEGDTEMVWAGTVAVGGNLDILGTLFK